MKYSMDIGVVGCGYVGLSTAIALAKKNNIHIFDIDKNKLNKLKEGQFPFTEGALMREYNSRKVNIFIEDKRDAFIKKCNLFILAVSTSQDIENASLETTGLEAWIKEIIECRANELVMIVIRSTTPIGFTDQMVLKYNCDKIVYWPEFLREGTAYCDTQNPSRIVIGGASQEVTRLKSLVTGTANIICPIHCVAAKEAEAIKLFANSYLAMRVAFFNELDAYAEKNNMDVRHIVDGVCDDPRIGHYYNNPSFGYGGYCLPKDSQQLATLLGNDGILINAIVAANEKRKRDIAHKIAEKGKRIGIYRLQMKRNSDDLRGAAVIDIIEELIKNGIRVNIYEPMLNSETELFSKVFLYKSVKEMADGSDIIISNRMSDELLPYSDKVYTRDIYFRD